MIETNLVTILLVALLVVVALVVVMLALALRRLGGSGLGAVAPRLDGVERAIDRSEQALREELVRGRQESAEGSRGLRGDVASLFSGFSDNVARQLELFVGHLGTLTTSSRDDAGKLREELGRTLEQLRVTFDTQITGLRGENTQKLDEIRRTVDDKLQSTLEERLGASFRQVSERLEQVHRGLGEMQVLAAGVGDLKRVLANVKTRGTWGEVQLGNLLEQVLAPEQYSANVATKDGSSERVEFAIRLPGPEGREGAEVWLPIDAKFPLELYQRLVEAGERTDAAAIEVAGRDLETRIKNSARDIRDKYLDVPRTTDFGILFLPVEGLYAEVLRRPGLVDLLQRDLRVMVAGPTTLWALLSSLRMGFRTLAIQRRSSEVWRTLGAVKTEFAKFGEALKGVQKKLDEASRKIDEAQRGSRRIEKHLGAVEELPPADSKVLLGEATPLFELDEDPDEAVDR